MFLCRISTEFKTKEVLLVWVLDVSGIQILSETVPVANATRHGCEIFLICADFVCLSITWPVDVKFCDNMKCQACSSCFTWRMCHFYTIDREQDAGGTVILRAWNASGISWVHFIRSRVSYHKHFEWAVWQRTGGHHQLGKTDSRCVQWFVMTCWTFLISV